MAEIKKASRDRQEVREETTAKLTVEEPTVLEIPKKKVMLNLGCGWKKYIDYINIDNRAEVNPDLLHDITQPFPYEDNSVDYILADDILEHVMPDDVVPLLKEIHRILKPEGVFHFSIPSTRGDGAFMDPTHRSYWCINSWLYYTDADWHALYPDLPFFKRLELRDEMTSEKLRIIHTKGKVSPVK